jgi:hypothetical protein
MRPPPFAGLLDCRLSRQSMSLRAAPAARTGKAFRALPGLGLAAVACAFQIAVVRAPPAQGIHGGFVLIHCGQGAGTAHFILDVVGYFQ